MAYNSNKGRKYITILKTSQLKAETNVWSSGEHFHLSEALESVYPLLEIVFSYLNYKDLQNAAKVNKSWQTTVWKILEKRNQISWISNVFKKRRHSVVNFSSNYGFSNAKLGIVLFNSKKVSMGDSFYCHTTNNMLDPKRLTFNDLLFQEVVPEGVQYCVMACPNVSSVFPKTLFKKSPGSLFDAIFIPDIPNVKVSMFHCDPPSMRDDYLEEGDTLRALLMFSKNDLAEDISKIIKHLIPEQHCNKVAVGGGIVMRAIVFPSIPRYCSRRMITGPNLCIAFTEKHDMGNESTFNAQSIVITGNNLSTEKFEQELIEFKQKITLRSNSMALRICCSAKLRKSHETKTFSKVFPQTPLIGLEAEGEIGWDCFSIQDNPEDTTESCPKKTKHGYPIFQHQWSTVIVVISWGHIIQNS